MAGIVRQLCTKINVLGRINPRNVSYKAPQPLCALGESRFYSNSPKLTPFETIDPQANKTIQQDIINKVNEQVQTTQEGRLFAVVHVAGKQFKITAGDLIIIEGYWPPDVGDKISLDKVMLLGAADFTLIGTPLVEDGLVNVQATVIEKTLSHTKTNFKKKRRKQYTNINFYRVQQTMLRINCIEIVGKLNEPPDVTGLEHTIL